MNIYMLTKNLSFWNISRWNRW